MDSSKIEISHVKVRRNLMASVLTVIIAAIALMDVTKHSNIRPRDLLAISGIGATIAMLIVKLVISFKLKKQRDSVTIIVIIAAIAFMGVTNHSNIRTVDLLAISGFGATIAVFIVNLVLFFKRNRQQNLTGTKG